MDRDKAQILGERKMGSMVDMVSQFEVDTIYTQINYKDNPVRVSPLRYANVIKWFTNMRGGIPAYIRINMATQTTELVKLEEGMKYTQSDHFNRNIYRHLRFEHPTYIYGDLSFEIDDNGKPYWVVSLYEHAIGYGGANAVGTAIVDAQTGEVNVYSIEDTPKWVDRIQPESFVVEQIRNLSLIHI